MDAKELRIGNYVIDTGDNNIYQIPSGASINNAHLAKPIPLTQEWFMKLHSQLIEKFFACGYKNGKITLHLSENIKFESEYLHKIQNLYFALTGEELIIKK